MPAPPTTRMLTETLQIRAPRGMTAAVAAAAAKHHTGPSEWARRVLIRGLEADGLNLRNGGVIEIAQPEEGAPTC